jgi:hypothetical protein
MKKGKLVVRTTRMNRGIRDTAPLIPNLDPSHKPVFTAVLSGI